MKYFLVSFFVCCSVFTSMSYAVSFTADAVQIRSDSVSQAKMFWLDGNVRFEYIENDVSMAQIFDNKNNKIIWLDNENKLFLEREMQANEKVTTGKKSKKTNDPCKQFAGAECVFLKKAKLNGRSSEKWLITLNNGGEDFHIFQWIDTKYKNILKQVNDDGSSLSVEIEDNQIVNERDVRKLTMRAFSAAGEQQQGVQWYDNKLDIVVKQQYKDDVIDELKNIKVGKVSKNLFVVPKKYTLFDTDIKTASQEDKSEGKVDIQTDKN